MADAESDVEPPAEDGLDLLARAHLVVLPLDDLLALEVIQLELSLTHELLVLEQLYL